jgi:high-affinity nickel-transport protein
LDWDHLAAITDLTSGQAAKGQRRSLALALWYCIGHGAVIVLLGAMVGLLGVRLPGGLDRVFEVIVGGTLVALGMVVLVQVAQQGRAYQFQSRWRVLLDVISRAWLRRQGRSDWSAGTTVISRRGAFGIGILHGTGAETPTQMVLFGAAATAGSTVGAVIVLVAFVVGLIASDVGVAMLWLTGRLGVVRVPGGPMALGLLTGMASVAVGVTFILQRSSLLPSLLGG